MSEPTTFFSSEPVLALRTWAVAGVKLKSWTFTRLEWPVAAPLAATCQVQAHMGLLYSGVRSHYVCHKPYAGPVPHEDGRCGVHGVAPGSVTNVVRPSEVNMCRFLSKSDPVIHVFSLARVIAGIVALWGRTILGEKGVYRAQFAYPVALFEAAVSGPIAEAYGVPLVPAPHNLDSLKATFEWARGQLKEVPSSEPG